MMQEDGAMHVLEGPERADDIDHDADYNLEDDQVKRQFKKFVLEYSTKDHSRQASKAQVDLELFYRKNFIQNCKDRLYFLQLNLNHMEHHEIGELLLHRLKQQPDWFISECEQGLKELYTQIIEGAQPLERAPHFQLQLTCDANLEGTSGSFKPIMLRDLVSSEVSKLVVIQ